MLKTASQVIEEAHQAGLIVILWMYPRGKDLKGDDPHLIAGGAGVSVSLGADFVKIHCINKEEFFTEAVKASGKTGIVCAGGATDDDYLDNLKFQLEHGTKGAAVGRNIHQKGLQQAIEIANKIYSLCIN